MGGGMHGGFGRTNGAAAGDASFMGPSENFLRNIRLRRDVDPNGEFDVIAHGSTGTIDVEQAGRKFTINARVAASLIRKQPGYKKGQPIRLLSCNTGANPTGFAQNLANKLNVVVYAPNKILWAWPGGHHIVAEASNRRGPDGSALPDLKHTGRFIKFTPGGNR